MLQTFSSASITVVLQFGKALTKVGFRGEDQPRAIIPTPELQLSRVSSSSDPLLLSTSLSVNEWNGVLHKLLQQIYFKHLRVSPSDHPVTLIEDDLTPTCFREALATLLFDQLRVPRLTYISDALAPLYLCGVSTGLIVDIGYLETRIIPVCFGVPLYRARQTLPMGSYSVNVCLRKCLLEDACATLTPPECAQQAQIQSLDDVTLDNIKVQCCYVHFEFSQKNKSLENSEIATPTESAETTKKVSFLSDKCLIYRHRVETPIYVSSTSRWKPCECLFTGTDNSPLGICDAVIRALEACPIDAKRYVVENVLLCGGSADIRGFQPRFALDLHDAIQRHNELSTPLLIDRLCIGAPNSPCLIRQWVGGSIYSAASPAIENAPNQITARQWATSHVLPDWVIPPELRVQEADTTNDILASATQTHEPELNGPNNI